MRLTSPFNLPAPGTRQPLYVVFDLAETCVFVKQSPDAIHCGHLRGTPYPEVTELYCLVPEQPITRAPENTLLVHMCLFVVRAPNSPTRIFPADDLAGLPLQISLRPDLKPLRLRTYALRPPAFNEFRWSRNINRVSISYAFRPRLRPRLTLSGLTFLRKP